MRSMSLIVLGLFCAMLGLGCTKEAAATKPAAGTNVAPQVHSKEGGGKPVAAPPAPPKIDP
jgi:hypothetical protein